MMRAVRTRRQDDTLEHAAREIHLSAPATASMGNDRLDCEIQDLSASGGALRVDRGCEAGRFVRLVIRVSPDFVRDVDAVVVRSARSGGHDVWGAAFVDLDESKARDRLRAPAAQVRRRTIPPPGQPRVRW